jgi:hypothetical protein
MHSSTEKQDSCSRETVKKRVFLPDLRQSAWHSLTSVPLFAAAAFVKSLN